LYIMWTIYIFTFFLKISGFLIFIYFGSIVSFNKSLEIFKSYELQKNWLKITMLYFKSKKLWEYPKMLKSSYHKNALFWAFFLNRRKVYLSSRWSKYLSPWGIFRGNTVFYIFVLVCVVTGSPWSWMVNFMLLDGSKYSPFYNPSSPRITLTSRFGHPQCQPSVHLAPLCGLDFHGSRQMGLTQSHCWTPHVSADGQ
jgi:hypothetical protein